MSKEKRLKTDSELLNGYSAYSDDQIVQFILQGNLHDWQKQQFERVLRLRRRKAYEDIVGISNQLTPKLKPTKPTKTAAPVAEPEESKKDKESGFWSILAAIAVSIFFLSKCQ